MTFPNPGTTALQCPKCAGEMRSYERSGIHVDQCRECRGIFLDRGELERLIDLEADAMGSAPAGPAAPPPYVDPRLSGPGGYVPDYGDPRLRGDRGDRGRDWDDDDDDDEGRFGGDPRLGGDPRFGRQGGPRRRGFLGDLFEGFGD